MTRVLITGASGFVGAALIAALARDGVSVRGAYRTLPDRTLAWESAAVGDLHASTNWSPALRNVTAVVHCAGPAHARFSEQALNNQIVEATVALAVQAEAAGVRRFVYLSSIKAACGHTEAGTAISEIDPPQPADAYGRAKLAAERAVLARAALNPIVLRPPLVIAANAKANFGRLLQLAASGLPLPVAGPRNQRSLLSRESLIGAVAMVLARPDDASGVFHLADRPALSTPAIVTALCEGLGRRATLFRGPAAILPRALTESLAVDDARFRAAYGDGWARDALAAVTACGAAYKVLAA
jgi:UDP-glucose 4-epimerase